MMIIIIFFTVVGWKIKKKTKKIGKRIKISFRSHLDAAQTIYQALNDDVFHVAGNFLFEVLVAIFRQTGGAYDYVLNGALEGPAHFLGVRTAARMMVLEVDLVLDGVGPFGGERFGPVVHAGFVGDLCKADGQVR